MSSVANNIALFRLATRKPKLELASGPALLNPTLINLFTCRSFIPPQSYSVLL